MKEEREVKGGKDGREEREVKEGRDSSEEREVNIQDRFLLWP